MSETAQATLCPRCELEEYGHRASLTDDQTLICVACSEVEVTLEAAGIPLAGPEHWPLLFFEYD